MEPSVEQVGILTRIVAAIVTFCATAWGIFAFRKNRADKADAKREAEASALQEKFDEKADAAEIAERFERHQKANEEQVKLLRADLDKRKEVEAKIFDQVREDNKAVMGAIGKLTDSFGSFAVQVTKELGQRPTREELSR